jgi:integrase
VGRVTTIAPGGRHLTCPVRALRDWLKVRGDAPGPLFYRFVGLNGRAYMTTHRLGGQGLCRVLKRSLESIGVDPKEYGAHSLRSGMITAADAQRVSLREIMDHTGHKQISTVLRYIKPHHSNPLAGIL